MTPQDPFSQDNNDSVSSPPSAESLVNDPAETNTAQPPATDVSVPSPAPQAQAFQSKQAKNPLIIGGVVLAVILILGGIGLALTAPKEKKTSQSTKPQSTSTDNQPSKQESSSSSSSLNPLAGQQAKAKDSKRKTDINLLETQLEAYYANTGNYPTLAQLNDATFRTQNMKSLDPAALQDPDGSSQTLVATPTKNSYAYEVFSSDGKVCTVATQCATYKLTATLSDGTAYQKESLQ